MTDMQIWIIVVQIWYKTSLNEYSGASEAWMMKLTVEVH